jgi:enoyl-CoA hydratase/carnithine racemase
VAAVEGLAIGVGTTMLLHCDLVYAAEGTRFQLPFTPLGLCPEAGSSYFLPRMAGYARAAELLLLGEPFGPDVALQIGLVARVLPPEDLHDHARDRALAVAALPPASVRVTKQLMKEAQRDAVRAHMGREVGHFLERLRSPEAAEAMQAFFAKRKPDFSRFE